MKIIKLKLEEELHKKFKIATAENESNMQATLVDLIKKYLKEGEEKVND